MMLWEASALLHQAVQRGLLGAAALALNRGAMRRPLGLPADRFHARRSKWWAPHGLSCETLATRERSRRRGYGGRCNGESEIGSAAAQCSDRALALLLFVVLLALIDVGAFVGGYIAVRASGLRRLAARRGATEARPGVRRLVRLASALQAQHPGAAASLREALEETLTLQSLGIGGALYRTLRITNPIENLNGSIGHYTRNVKRWRAGEMTLR
jgi:hypothetical protein